MYAPARVLPLALVASLSTVLACDSAEPEFVDPRFRALAGSYVAIAYTEFGFFSSCSYYDALARGGFFQMRLGEDGSVKNGLYFSGVEGGRVAQECAPFGSSHIAFHGAFTLSGDTLTLDLEQSCQGKWHRSKWLIEAQTMQYLGFDEGRGPCMPEVTLRRQPER